MVDPARRLFARLARPGVRHYHAPVARRPSLFVRVRNQVRAALGLGRVRSFGLFARAVHGRAGLEIGGPSGVFTRLDRLPLYDRVGSLDNCVSAGSTVWAEQSQDYTFSRRRAPGRCFVLETTALIAIPDRSYDFVLFSHALEHVANPVKALREWARVLRPGGALVLVLPDYRRTFGSRCGPWSTPARTTSACWPSRRSAEP